MFENLFPLLGQLITTGIVGALLGGSIALLAAQIASAGHGHGHGPRPHVTPRPQLTA